MKSAHLQKHLNKHRYLVRKLQRSGRDTTLILSILLTESYFRNEQCRNTEYLAWLILNALGVRRAEYISLGIAQIQYRYWLRCSAFPSSCLARLKNFRDPFMNYDVCLKYLHSKSGSSNISLCQLSELYTGRVQKYYMEVLRLCRGWIEVNSA